MTETLPGREPVQLVEIEQPICANVYGVSPCTASGDAALKCYNTRATCQDTANYALSDTPLRLFFAHGRVADMGVPGVPYIIPSLVSVSTSPTKINLASANPDAQGLGNRAMCSITFQDHQHTDRVVDPYLSDRTWDSLSPDRGSFWSRWIVRNKYRQNVVIHVYEGYAGQTLTQMKRRTYFLQTIKGPDGGGRVVIEGKDILARLEERKAQAPVASPGVLYTDIDSEVTLIQIAGAVQSDYPDGFNTLRIGDEILTYTSSNRDNSTGVITITGVTRGTDGTVADAHSVDTAVQLCLRYGDDTGNGVTVTTALTGLLQNYAEIPTKYLDVVGWGQEFTTYMSLYRVSAVISDPTPVAELVSEIQTNTMCYLWWDERTSLVKMRAVRGVADTPPTITEEANIISGTFSLTEKPRERASQVWVYYNQRNPVEAVDDESNYDNLFIAADLDSETDELYGEQSIRKIYGRWLNSDALAQATGNTILTRYVDIPSQCKFRLDAKDRQYWVGDSFYISHHLDVDQYGQRRLRQWTVISAEEVAPGETVEYVCEDTTLYSRIYFIQESGAADYSGDPTLAYIGGADGLLSDETLSARIS